MSKPPCSTAAEQLRARVIFIDNLKQQILDLEALREKVAEAERVNDEKKKRKRSLLSLQ
jgi:hypothetical protein